MAVQLRNLLEPHRSHSKPPFEIVKYAYCLLDLAAEDSKSPGKVFKKNKGYISEEISSEVKWQIPCRTNGKGYLVAIDESDHTMMNLYYRNDADARPHIDKLPPLMVNLGTKFNLYWTYHRSQFDLARHKNSCRTPKENQLLRCSTMLNLNDQKMFIPILLRPVINIWRTKFKTQKELVEKVKKLFMRYEHKYHRFVINAGAEPVSIRSTYRGLETKFRLTPHLQLKDHDLEHAMGMANLIIEAAETPQQSDYLGNIARLEEVLRIIKSRGKERSFNSVIQNFYRREAVTNEFSNAKWRIENSYSELSNYIQSCGKRLKPLYSNALLQAADHHPKKDACEYIERIQKAASIVAARELWDKFMCSEKNYLQAMEAVKKARKGKQPAGFMESILASYQNLDAMGLDKSAGFIEKSSEWIEAFLPKIVKQKPDQVAATLNRINHFLHYIESPDNAGKPIQQVFKLQPKGITVTIKDADGNPQTLNLKEQIGKVGKVATRVGQFCNVVNLALALKETLENPDFKNCLKSFKEASEAANAFKAVREKLAKHLGLTETILTRVAGCALIVISFIEAADALKKGNNVKVLGEMVVACAGTMQVLSRGGVVGWLAAAVILTGVLIIYFSLDKDEKFLIAVDKSVTYAKYVPDHRFLRRQNIDFAYHDRYLKERGN